MNTEQRMDVKENMSREQNQDEVELTDTELKTIDVDDVWRFLGRHGKYQATQLSLSGLIFSIMVLPVLSGMFTGKIIDFKCFETGGSLYSNSTAMTSSCHLDNITSDAKEEKACSQYEYEGGSTTLSYIAEWDLVCARETLGQLPQILAMVGMVLGASLLPQLGDRFGRRMSVLSISGCLFVVTMILPFVKQFELFMMFKFLSGAFQQGALVSTFTLQLEVMPLESGSFIAFLASVWWVVGMCLVGGVSYIFRSFEWRVLQLAFALVPVPVFIISLWLLDESVRWLLENGKKKQLISTLRKACRVNNKDYNELMETVLKTENDKEELFSDVSQGDDELPEKKSNFVVMIKHRVMRTITLVIGLAWMVSALTYYGLILLSTSLEGNPYVNFFLGVLAELLAAFVLGFSLQRFGRKKTIMSALFVAGASLLLAVIVSTLAPSASVYTIIQMCLTLIGKFMITISLNGLWLYTPELYPTNCRNIGTGIGSSAARMGAAFTPLFTILSRKLPWAPGTVFSIGCFISAFLLIMIPETRWRELPRSFDEVNMWFKKDKPHPTKTNNIFLSEDISSKTTV